MISGSSATSFNNIAWQPAISTTIVPAAVFSPQQHLPVFVKAGFKMIELNCCQDPVDWLWKDPVAVEDIRRIVDDLDMKIWSIHPPDKGSLVAKNKNVRVRQLDIIRKFVDMAVELKASVLCVHTRGNLHNETMDCDTIARFRDSMGELHEYVCASGVMLCLETTTNVGSALSNKQLIKEVECLDEDSFGVLIDMGHSNIGGDIYDTIPLMRNRLHHVHLHDNDGSDDLHQIPGEGIIDWAKVILDLRKISYKGPLMLEIQTQFDKDELMNTLNNCSRAVHGLQKL